MIALTFGQDFEQVDTLFAEALESHRDGFFLLYRGVLLRKAQNQLPEGGEDLTRLVEAEQHFAEALVQPSFRSDIDRTARFFLVVSRFELLWAGYAPSPETRAEWVEIIRAMTGDEHMILKEVEAATILARELPAFDEGRALIEQWPCSAEEDCLGKAKALITLELKAGNHELVKTLLTQERIEERDPVFHDSAIQALSSNGTEASESPEPNTAE